MHPVISVQHLEPAPPAEADPFGRGTGRGRVPPQTTGSHRTMTASTWLGYWMSGSVSASDLATSSEYFVQWEGLPNEEAEWVQEHNAVGCADLYS